MLYTGFRGAFIIIVLIFLFFRTSSSYECLTFSSRAIWTHRLSTLKMAQLETSFSLLPEELIRIVFSYLPSQDLLTCRQVCSEFKNYLDASSIWKSFIKARDVYEEAVLSKVTPWKAFLYLRKKETDWKKGRFVIVNQDDGIKSFDFNKVSDIRLFFFISKQ